MEYKALWVKPETHKMLKLRAVDYELTIDELIHKLLTPGASE